MDSAHVPRESKHPTPPKCEFHDDAQLIELVKARVQVNQQRPSCYDLFPDIWNMVKMPPAIIGITSGSG